MDNPGLGEAKEHIVQAINVSWESSAAYVYLTSAQNIAQKAEAETFKAFHAKGEKVAFILGSKSSDHIIIIINFKVSCYSTTSSCARSACFATFARTSLRSLCHRALQLILCVAE